MIVVTGAAGFIGSNLVAALDAEGEAVVACDRLGDGDKWRNLGRHVLADFVAPERLVEFIAANHAAISAVYHLGAISDTTVRDGDLVMQANFATSVALWRECAARALPLFYASSAAVYGGGEHGFDDANALDHLRRLRPLNLYGWSKWLFDCWVLQAVARGAPAPPRWAGLRFFNVFGPNEYHKGAMQSLVCKIASGYRPGVPARLFKSYRPDIPDGEQKRDFVWVDDIVVVMLWLRGLARPAGILNLGTGTARSFLDLARATLRACGDEPAIEFVDMPEAIRPAYQYYTCADMARLRGLGYDAPFTPLETAVTQYVTGFLRAADRYR